MGIDLSKKERLRRAVRFDEVDRFPTVGGWMLGVRILSQVARLSVQEFMAQPERGVWLANQALQVDAMSPPVIPRGLEQVRDSHVAEGDYEGIEPEALVERANQLPESEAEIIRRFDAKACEAEYRRQIETFYRKYPDLELLPTWWEMSGKFPLYLDFGYIAFLSACALYPEAVEKLWWEDAVRQRLAAQILVGLYREYDLVPILFTGQDLCNSKGPMVSPALLRERYFPHVRRILEPLVDAGIQVIFHCDGDVRPILDDMIEMGAAGFQGFQYELGLELSDLRAKTTLHNKPPLLMAGLSVTCTLPLGNTDDVRKEVDYFVRSTDGGKGFLLFTSNVTGVDVPPENIRAGYLYTKLLDPSRGASPGRVKWPWGARYRFVKE